MIKSMTGFGKSICQTSNASFSIELRTLNSKQADISVKCPNILNSLEAEIRSLLAQSLERGKISLNINVANNSILSACSINTEQARHWYNQFKKLATEIELNHEPDYMSLLIKMPEVINNDTTEITDNEKDNILNAINEAIKEADEFRINEGEALKNDLALRISIIEDLLTGITPFESARTNKLKEKIRKDFCNYEHEINIDENRFEQELFYYLERMDINEEKVRLSKHCSHFIDTMKRNEASGRKLSFIAQEIGREINTIGSKANDYDIQHNVVLMKDELEKIKEQILNIL